MSARLVIVFVVDGLRPDAITEADTPTLCRLRAQGVRFTNTHSAFPTVTRVNAATIVTGAHPGTHGIVGNQLYVPAVDPTRAIDTSSWRRLLEVDAATEGRLLQAPTLAERLAARGLSLAAVSSGSTGSALLTNHRAPSGTGALVNGYIEPGARVAWPDELNSAILGKLGPAPSKGRGAARHDDAVTWTQRVLREHVLAELRPAVVINWITEPDHTQHAVGVGSPSAREALRHADHQIGLVLRSLDDLGLAQETDILVASDHGFSTNTRGIDVGRELIEAGLATDGATGDLVLASSGQAVGLHVAGRDADRIARIARFVQSHDWGGVLFTEAREPGDPRGRVDGTFSLELAQLGNAERSPDLLVTFPWSSEANAFGIHGADLACVSGGAALHASDHGSMSPWNVRSTLLAWGPDFAEGATVTAPAGNIDVAPTILALLGIDDKDGMDGRVLAESFADQRRPAEPATTRTYMVEAGSYRAALDVSTAGGHRYLDKAGACADGRDPRQSAAIGPGGAGLWPPRRAGRLRAMPRRRGEGPQLSRGSSRMKRPLRSSRSVSSISARVLVTNGP